MKKQGSDPSNPKDLTVRSEQLLVVPYVLSGDNQLPGSIIKGET